MSAADKQRIAFVGVGRMGAAMLQPVLDAGYHVTLFDPAPEATAPFAKAHPELVTVAASARQAAERADITEIVVNTNEQLITACTGPDGVFHGAPRGSVVLVHSTVSHETLQRLERDAAERGIQLLDAPVSGARGHLSAGNLAVMVGGEAEAFERAKPVMQTYGGLVLHLGKLGAGMDAKLAINMLRYIVMAASQEATYLAQATGVGAHLAQLVAHTEANRFVGNLARLAEIPLQRRQTDAELAQKDLRAAIARGTELGVKLPSAELAVGLMHRMWGAE
jgi:3-hydroxyisobutyrate dehydrogenase-like beta-hydroxyacid dehydrogenase